MPRFIVVLPLVIGLVILWFLYPLSGADHFSDLMLKEPLSVLTILSPFIVLVGLIVQLLRTNTLPIQQLWFLVVSGCLGILIVLLPGVDAAWDVARNPSNSVWLLLGFFTLISEALAMGAAYIIIHYLWLDR